MGTTVRPKGKKRDLGWRIKVTSGNSERTYQVNQSDLSPVMVRAIRSDAGFAGWGGLNRQIVEGMDIDVIAALIWLARISKGEENLSYDLVLARMSYDDEYEVTALNGSRPIDGTDLPDDDEDADPEA